MSSLHHSFKSKFETRTNIPNGGVTSHPKTRTNLNAEPHRELYPEVAKAILDDRHVTDFLVSFRTENESEKISSELRCVHGTGGVFGTL